MKATLITAVVLTAMLWTARLLLAIDGFQAKAAGAVLLLLGLVFLFGAGLPDSFLKRAAGGFLISGVITVVFI